MPIIQIIKKIHHMIEVKNTNRITQQEMADRLGISKRTYVEYMRGTNRPKGMIVLLDLLCELSEEELVTLS